MRESEAWAAEQRAAEMASTEAMRAAALLPEVEYTFTDAEVAEFNVRIFCYFHLGVDLTGFVRTHFSDLDGRSTAPDGMFKWRF